MFGRLYMTIWMIEILDGILPLPRGNALLNPPDASHEILIRRAVVEVSISQLRNRRWKPIRTNWIKVPKITPEPLAINHILSTKRDVTPTKFMAVQNFTGYDIGYI